MIKLTRLDRQEIAINSDLIVWVEAHPDTTLRLATGERILVREGLDEVVRRIAAFRSGVLRDAGLAGLSASDARPPLPAPAADRPGSAWEPAGAIPAEPEDGP
jgi:flagellar protein FlbD